MTTWNCILPTTWILEAGSSLDPPDKSPASQNLDFGLASLYEEPIRTHLVSDLRNCELISGYCFKLLNSWLFVTQLRKPTHCLTLWGVHCDAHKDKERKVGSPYWFLWAGKGTVHTAPNRLSPSSQPAGGLVQKGCLIFSLVNTCFRIMLSFAFFYASCCKLWRDMLFGNVIEQGWWPSMPCFNFNFTNYLRAGGYCFYIPAWNLHLHLQKDYLPMKVVTPFTSGALVAVIILLYKWLSLGN